MKRFPAWPLGALLTVLMCCPPALAKDVQCWRLKQTSEFYGPMELLIGPTAIKFLVASAGISVIAMPGSSLKTSKVIAFKEADKTKFESTVDEWEHTVMHRKELPKLTGVPWRKGKSATIAGLNATQYFNFTEGKAPSITAKRMAVLSPGTAQHVELWTTRDIKVLPEFTSMISMLTSTPPGTGVPLRTFRLAKGKEVKTLDTKQAEHVNVSDKEFVVPQGLKKVSNYMDLVLGGESGMGMGLDLGGSGMAGGSPLPGADKSVKKPMRVPTYDADTEREWEMHGRRLRRF